MLAISTAVPTSSDIAMANTVNQCVRPGAAFLDAVEQCRARGREMAEE